MYTSINWLNELVNLETTKLEDLIEKLTLGGFEVEEVLKIDLNKQQKTVLDVSATANRADSLSVKGIAKEITSLLNEQLKNSKYTTKSLDSFRDFEKIITLNKNHFGCSIFIGVTVQNLTNLIPPRWLKEKLICCKVEPQNNVLDFITYITLETGYPFEIYDLEKIQSKVENSTFILDLDFATKNSTFIANNGVEYKLDSPITILKANNYPLSIGGLISNQDFAYTSETKALLIEGSIFSSQQIRQQSRLLGLRTERSGRYEKGLSEAYFIDALIRLLSLLKNTNPNLICKIHTASKSNENTIKSIILNYKNVLEILGPIKNNEKNQSNNLTPLQINSYLKRLDFDFVFNNENKSWAIEIPLVRTDDIQREIDIIEEIGRLHGFNNFLTDLPIVDKSGKEDPSYQIRKKLTTYFLNEGLNELVHYSLENEDSKNLVELINPLINDYSKLRASLLPSLIKTVSNNLKQSNNIIEGFEYGHVFVGEVPNSYQEEEVVSGIFGGVKIKRLWNDLPKSLSWFEAKGKLEDLFKKLNFFVEWRQCSIQKYAITLHPYKTAELWLDSKYFLGVFGQIHPIIAKQYNIPNDLFLFELNLDEIKNNFEKQKLSLYKPYSLYPKITKDLSFVIDQNIPFANIESTIWKNGSKYLTDITLLDEYRGSNIPEHQTSLCIQLTFQAAQKTLITKEIEEIINKIEDILKQRFKITVRI